MPNKSVRDMGYSKTSNIHVIGIPGGGEGTEAIFKEILVENFFKH